MSDVFTSPDIRPAIPSDAEIRLKQRTAERDAALMVIRDLTRENDTLRKGMRQIRAAVASALAKPQAVPTCRACGCTDDDCLQCIARTGAPCHWVEPDLCSACRG